MKSQHKVIDLPIKGDERCSLIAIESMASIPFEVKRVYYIFNTLPDVRRGFHAHRKLSQLLVCMHGQCKVFLDDGATKDTVILNKPDQGLLIEGFVWREMFDFSADCVLMVLASHHYDEADYIRNYDLFLAEAKSLNQQVK
jgi:UDP-2-acetamido-3-amino-2,3-dideoxy-glucuronate N-acetyltransferase